MSINHRSLRLPLLACLAILVASFLALPRAAEAAPTCGGSTGHFTDCDPVYGWTSAACGSQYCQVGNICWEWDCVQESDGSIHIANTHTYGPTFCACGTSGWGCC